MSEIIQKARGLSGFRGDLSGEIYETMVVSEIIKWMKTVQRQEEIYFYCTSSGLELDILLQTEKGIIGMEIKARTAVASADLRAMREVVKGLGKEWRGDLWSIWVTLFRRLGSPIFGLSLPEGCSHELELYCLFFRIMENKNSKSSLSPFLFLSY